MRNTVKFAAAGAVLGGSLFTAGLGLASADPVPGPPLPADPVPGQPLPASNVVDLAIGNVKVLQAANLETAASVAGAVCNINTSETNSLAERATTATSAQTICSLPAGAVTFSQASSVNGGAGPAAAPGAVAPGNPGNPWSPVSPGNPMLPSEQQPS